MKVQIVGLGNVGRSLLELMLEEKAAISCLGLDFNVVSISDSNGSVIDEEGIDLKSVIDRKRGKWLGCEDYHIGYKAIDAIRSVDSDLVVELTPSTRSGEPGLSHIATSLKLGKNVVTANKGPLVAQYDYLRELSNGNGAKLLYEATVSAQLPIFCLLDSCFIVDKVEKLEGIFNATTNFIIGEVESGKTFEQALDHAIKAGWAETNYSDDVDGVDSARKLVILANTLYDSHSKLEDVEVKGIRGIEPLVNEARGLKKKVKLLCELSRVQGAVRMTVSPKMFPLDDPFATINQGNMGVRFTFKNSQEIFISAQFNSPRQTAYAVLNDMIKADK
jgi:homoserine dehydrogenase